MSITVIKVSSWTDCTGSRRAMVVLRRASPRKARAMWKIGRFSGSLPATAKATADVARDSMESWRVEVYNGSKQPRKPHCASRWVGTRTKFVKNWQIANCSGVCPRPRAGHGSTKVRGASILRPGIMTKSSSGDVEVVEERSSGDFDRLSFNRFRSALRCTAWVWSRKTRSKYWTYPGQVLLELVHW